ncbi:MAG: hypothetical protein KIT44_09400 [Opitutaceae bacterium]|nr:hypothetical protein [Opitutaceae bacterium]
MNTHHSQNHGRQLVVAHNSNDGAPRQIVGGKALTPEQANAHNRNMSTGSRLEQESREVTNRVNKINEALIEKQRVTGMSRIEAYLALKREGHELFN